MSLPAIEVSGLSKRYVIEHESRHDSLRDTLHHAARKVWRRARWGTGFEKEEFWALRDLSFLVLTHACDDVTEAMRQEVPPPPAVLKEHGRNALRAIAACRADVARVVSHLETHGVSVGLVYRVEKVGAILDLSLIHI